MTLESVSESESKAAFRACTRGLIGHLYQSPKEILTAVAEYARPDEWGDHYGVGEMIQNFESLVGGVLGKPAAAFFPSGTMAQPIALRIWSDTKGIRRVAFHPTAHLELHEHHAYRALHGLEATLIGDAGRLFTAQEVAQLVEPISCCLIELPQREIGGLLPSWEELVAITTVLRERGIAVHMDGARLWEAMPHFGRSYAEICALFDSVYVSFYKKLGAVSGALLAGPEEFIAQARIWQRRQGGNIVTNFMEVLSARKAFEERLPKMDSYHRRAIEVARVLSSFEGVRVVPDPPQAAMMHIYVAREASALERAAFQIAKESKVALSRRFFESEVPGVSTVELSIGDLALEISDDELRSAFGKLLELSKR